ncbi:poly-gamma-glutamate biosynthesis protein PgsC/CapC [Streptomyces triticirhizae]|uniref:Capsule biosynthesis protein capC n=1 Tax=Streptomyces triticirhizae TaxID=2483353 RepID=A0A3M2M5I2_9ACTN|nr:poly-gamma-glutamate biosynthesis protein PgsC/CapC [Streptomyces triticirhizae]RMI45014.1 capsule biosynthesis protein capC [Streptomyces triticirhizae]
MSLSSLPPDAAALGIGLGLLFSLVCYLTTNLSPGGMITPGWLAITLFEDPRQTAMVVAASGATYAGSRLLQGVVILYGKRLFAAVVLFGVVLQATLFLLLREEFPMLYSNETLGFVVPGLIAYQLLRQPRLATGVSVVSVTLLTYAVLLSGLLLGLIPKV